MFGNLSTENQGPVAGPPPIQPAAGRQRRTGRPSLIAAVAAGVVVGAAIAAGIIAWQAGAKSSPTAIVSVPVTGTTIAAGVVTTSGPASTDAPMVTAAPTVTTEAPTTTMAATASTAAGDTLAEGDALLKAGELQDAIAAYQRALQADPDSAIARARLGVAYLLTPDVRQLAQQELEAAIEADPGNVEAMAFLGDALFNDAYGRGTGDYSSAEQTLQAALKRDPDSALAHVFLGEVYVAQGRADEGLKEALRGVELNPGDYWTQSTLGFVRGLRGEWSDAVGPYRDAVGLQPNLAFLHLLLSEALRRTGQYDESIEWAESALALGQGYDVRAYTAIGHALWLKRDMEGAVDSFQKALSIDDSDAYANWGLGAVLFRQGEYAQAVDHLQKAATTEPGEGQYHSWLGACLVNLKRYQEGKKELERALELDPTITEAQDLLEQLKAAGY